MVGGSCRQTDAGPAPSDGRYTIKVVDAVPGCCGYAANDATGSYNVSLQAVSATFDGAPTADDFRTAFLRGPT